MLPRYHGFSDSGEVGALQHVLLRFFVLLICNTLLSAIEVQCDCAVPCTVVLRQGFLAFIHYACLFVCLLPKLSLFCIDHVGVIWSDCWGPVAWAG